MTTAIDIFGVTISEPVTSVTDWLVTGVAWWLGSTLCGIVDERRSLTLYWGVGFWLIGLGALLGGVGHAFATYLGDDVYFWIWKATIYSIALSVTFALAGTINSMPFRAIPRKVFHGLNIGVFAMYATWMLSHSAFKYVIWHYIPVMLAIASLHTTAWTRDRDDTGRWIIVGVVVTLAGAALQRSGFTIHRWFNHNDLYHIVQIAGLWLFHKGLTGQRNPSGASDPER